MEKFRTEVNIERQEELISYDANMLFMGSCFASNIGQYFTDIQFNALVNPFGVLYNPFSIAKGLERLLTGKLYSEQDLVSHNSIWQSFDHHSRFNHQNKTQCIENINNSLIKGSEFLKKTDVLFITFGTSWVYELKSTGDLVSNCHKFPAHQFQRSLKNVDSIVDHYNTLITQLINTNPKLRIVLTASPVRHWKDGAHGNQLSKATLLLAIDELCKQFNSVQYFPAYELLLDDLRDYRFFNSDMLHPSPTAIEYIRNKFSTSWLDDTAHSFHKQIAKLLSALKHRPFDPSSKQHQEFLQKNIIQTMNIQQQYPKIDVDQILTDFKSKLC